MERLRLAIWIKVAPSRYLPSHPIDGCQLIGDVPKSPFPISIGQLLPSAGKYFKLLATGARGNAFSVLSEHVPGFCQQSMRDNEREIREGGCCGHGQIFQRPKHREISKACMCREHRHRENKVAQFNEATKRQLY
jgi:hypothetical protein